ncbi:MAG: hypothetical protein HYU52_14125 [Acidobacteria bacterium]|nr:hypothetical protein [Acidobacteriota bacterium]
MTTLKALEIWTAQSVCDVGILLSFVSLLLHLGRPYFERILGRLTLRVAADLWWLAYVVLRDGTLLVAALCGLWCLNLDLMADIKIALPFVPLATVALVIALALKVFGNAEDLNRRYRGVVLWVALAAFLNMIGYVFVMEAPGPEYAVARQPFWQAMRALRSNANPDLAVATFYVTLLLIGGVTVFAIVRSFGLLRAIPSAERDDV